MTTRRTLLAATLALATLTACGPAPDQPYPSISAALDTPGMDYSIEGLLNADSLAVIYNAYTDSTEAEQHQICTSFLAATADMDNQAFREAMVTLDAQDPAADQQFQALDFECGKLINTPTAAPKPTPTPKPTEAYVYTLNQIFSPAIGDMLNTFDLGDRHEKLRVCSGMSNALAGVSSAELQRRSDAMDALDFTMVEDLARDCATLVGLK